VEHERSIAQHACVANDDMKVKPAEQNRTECVCMFAQGCNQGMLRAGHSNAVGRLGGILRACSDLSFSKEDVNASHACMHEHECMLHDHECMRHEHAHPPRNSSAAGTTASMNMVLQLVTGRATFTTRAARIPRQIISWLRDPRVPRMEVGATCGWGVGGRDVC
jgi:hypothetical protein